MEITFKRIFRFNKAAQVYITSLELPMGSDTLLTSALKDILQQFDDVNDEYSDKKMEIDRNNAAVDNRKLLIKDPTHGFMYTPEGDKAREDQIKDLNNSTPDMHIKISMVPEIPKNLDKMYIPHFVGFVFDIDTPVEK